MVPGLHGLLFGNTFELELPLPHRNGKAIACSGKIYFMGGYCEDVRETSNYEFDPQKNEWTIKADVPIGRSNFAVASLEDRIFVIGGDPVLPDNDLYLTGENKWTVLTPLSIPRQHIDCGRIGNKIYVFDVNKNNWGTGSRLPKGIQFPGVEFIRSRGNRPAPGLCFGHRNRERTGRCRRRSPCRPNRLNSSRSASPGLCLVFYGQRHTYRHA